MTALLFRNARITNVDGHTLLADQQESTIRCAEQPCVCKDRLSRADRRIRLSMSACRSGLARLEERQRLLAGCDVFMGTSVRVPRKVEQAAAIGEILSQGRVVVSSGQRR